MTNPTPPTVASEALSPVKRALLEIRELRARVAELEGAAREPVAVLGAGLRLPAGLTDLPGLWAFLERGGDAVTEIPAERWSLDELYDPDPDAPGRMITRHGAFVDHVEHFDAEFFGISPREAESMDPQQRVLLETAWHALEDAGVAPASLQGSRTGVFLGICNSDYGRALFAHRERIDPYFSPGSALSVAAGRISYLLGLQGPAVSVDTACSSSLVALHLAMQSLRSGECDLALAGGVNLILTPEMNINFSKARMMAADGRCKTFDAAADGYVRGEGCGLVVLRRLRDCTPRDRLLAQLRGSAMNQDGRSSGLTAPNGPAQEAVLQAALQAAGVQAHEVGYVEAHGTGTSLGDPIEVQALGAVFGARAEGLPRLAVGSIKTNLGHLEAAAGIAGLFKAILAVHHGVIPPHLHLKTPSPHIDWAASGVVVPTTPTPWPAGLGRRIAGVSSFGFSGTNAHVIVESAPPSVPTDRPATSPHSRHVMALSARDGQALAALALAAAERVHAEPAALADLCHTANTGRSPLAQRASARAAEATGMAQALQALARGEAPLGTARGERRGTPRVAFLYTGGGAQTVGMARALYDSAPAFRRTFDEAAAVLDPWLGRPLRELIDDDRGDASPLHHTRNGQPAQVAVALALTALWRSWGIRPAAVLGHSLGEYAAAHAAGLVSLPDTLAMVMARAAAVDALDTAGSMATVFAAPAEVQAWLDAQRGAAVIAAYNGPQQVVVSGPVADVEAAASHFEACGVRVSRLRVAYASHSPLMEPALRPFEQAIAGVTYRPMHTTLVSNLTGAPVAAEVVGSAAYWRDHLRQPVRFEDSIRALAALGITHYVEIGPHPVLVGMGAACVEDEQALWLPSLRRQENDWDVMLEALQQLHATGVDPDWHGLDEGAAPRLTSFPIYPFQRRRYWADWAFDGALSEDAGHAWHAARAALESQAARAPIDTDLSDYAPKWACLRRLSFAHVTVLLRERGLYAAAGAAASAEEVRAALRAAPTYRHLLQRWLQGLCEDGLLCQDDETYVAPAPLPEVDLTAHWTEARSLLPDNAPLLDYLQHCSSLLGSVLSGEQSPLETLFPGGSFELADGLYRRSATMRYVNELAAAALSAFADASPGRPLRVLEVGAGTGGTTSALLPRLPAARTHYRFTDVSSVFFDRAREEFGAAGDVEFVTFDLDRELAEQGIAAASADVVVAANAVHACKDLRAALRRLRELVAPGGMLVLIESTEHLAWFDISTGLIEGWQHFADDLRTDNPLLSPATWVRALREAGFDDAVAFPGDSGAAAALAQHVIAAHVAGVAPRTAEPTGAAPEARSGSAAPAATAASVLRDALERAAPAERTTLLREFVRERVMAVLRLPSDAPPALQDRLMEIGFDSLMAVQLRNQLARGLGLDKPLSATLMFDQPTIEALAAHLRERLFPAAPKPVDAPSASLPTTGRDDIAAMSDEEVAALLEKRLESR